MNTKEASTFNYRHIYPRMRYVLGAGRKAYNVVVNMQTRFGKRPTSSSVIPDAYTVCNTSTIDSDYTLKRLDGDMPADIAGSLYIDQCLGAPEAFMIGDTNIVRLDFDGAEPHLTNRLMWTPADLARVNLAGTKHRFDFFGLMYLSPGIGMYSYTEGMYLLPDGRIAVTSDVDRPWAIERDTLRAVTPIGRRDEWLPMMKGSQGDVMGTLFAGYSNSHVAYTDHEQGEVFFVSYQYKQQDDTHPVKLMRWDGYHDFESWLVVDEQGAEIEIKQSIHELIFTRDYVLLADTAFVAGTEMLTPWVNAPLPMNKTVVYIVDRRELTADSATVTAKRIEVDEPCIHLIAEYDNPDDKITLYMLQTPATNTAELLRANDRDLDGNLFPEHLIGYGTLPVLDLSSIGKHILDVKQSSVISSDYIAEMPYTWGPYLYTYMGRQIEAYNGQDLFVMFKGFSRDMLPERIYKAYKDIDNRRVPIEDMVSGKGINHNNSICRITTDDFAIADAYVLPDRTLLYTIACLDSTEADHAGYVIAGVVTDDKASDESSGHEYWLFEADNLAKGPITKLGHESLNNSTLFHTVYIPKSVAEKLDKVPVTYNVNLREDYPAQELSKWDESVLQSFEDVIWNYFDPSDEEEKHIAEQRAEELATHSIATHAGKEHIIGEEYLNDAGAFAERMFEEAERMWHTTGWKLENTSGGVIVESKPVSGVFEPANILVMRSRGKIQASAQEAFAFLVSPEGYAVLDPVSNADDHHQPVIESYPWKDNTRLEAAKAQAKIPFVMDVEFVVLNAIDYNTLTFVSKSILHKDVPGGSSYSDIDPVPDSKQRALNTFAVKLIPAQDGTCEMLCINYIDMGKGGSPWLYNLINRRFFAPIYKRLNTAMNPD